MAVHNLPNFHLQILICSRSFFVYCGVIIGIQIIRYVSTHKNKIADEESLDSPPAYFSSRMIVAHHSAFFIIETRATLLSVCLLF